jgi:hypothetical protein
MHEEMVDNILHSLIPEHYDKKKTEKKDFPPTRSAEFCTKKILG